MRGEGNDANGGRLVREGFLKEVTFEQSLEGDEGPRRGRERII